jgi:hypothetical protein
LCVTAKIGRQGLLRSGAVNLGTSVSFPLSRDKRTVRVPQRRNGGRGGTSENLEGPRSAARPQSHFGEITLFSDYNFSMAKNPLHIVPGPDPIGLHPSRPLGDHGQSLWDRITAEYVVEDAAGIEFLTQACQAVDRAAAIVPAPPRDRNGRAYGGSVFHGEGAWPLPQRSRRPPSRSGPMLPRSAQPGARFSRA